MTLKLCDGDHVLGENTWIDENDLLETLLIKIEELLKSHGLSIKNISEAIFINHATTGVTSQRIAKTIMETLNYSVSVEK